MQGLDEVDVHKKKAEEFAKEENFRSAYNEMQAALAAVEVETQSASEEESALSVYEFDKHIASCIRIGNESTYIYKRGGVSSDDVYKAHYANAIVQFQGGIDWVSEKNKKFPKTIQDCRYLSQCYSGLGWLLKRKEKFTEAKEHQQKAYDELQLIPKEHWNELDRINIEIISKNLRKAIYREYESEHGFFGAIKKYGLFDLPPLPPAEVQDIKRKHI